MARAQEVRLTHADYLTLPEDGRRYEIIAGELVVSPSSTLSHQRVVMNALRLLFAWLAEHPAGELFTAPLDVIMANDTVVQPDIVYVTHERLPEVAGKWIHGAPDLVVEVLSPSTRARDLTVKRKVYAQFGVREYWVLDPESRALTILGLSGKRYQELASGVGTRPLASSVLAGLRISPADLFRRK